MSQRVRVIVRVIEADKFGNPVRVEFILFIEGVEIGRFPSKLAAESKAREVIKALQKPTVFTETSALDNDDELDTPTFELLDYADEETLLLLILGVFALLFIENDSKAAEVYDHEAEARDRFNEITAQLKPPTPP